MHIYKILYCIFKYLITHISYLPGLCQTLETPITTLRKPVKNICIQLFAVHPNLSYIFSGINTRGGRRPAPAQPGQVAVLVTPFKTAQGAGQPVKPTSYK